MARAHGTSVLLLAHLPWKAQWIIYVEDNCIKKKKVKEDNSKVSIYCMKLIRQLSANIYSRNTI